MRYSELSTSEIIGRMIGRGIHSEAGRKVLLLILHTLTLYLKWKRLRISKYVYLYTVLKLLKLKPNFEKTTTAEDRSR